LRQVRDALDDSERRFRDLLNQIQAAAVFLDTHGRITFCNAFLLGLTGYREEDLLGKDWFERFYPAEKQASARQTLQRVGYTVLDAADGEMALKLCDEHAGPVHLVVADVVMPRMSGVECVKRLLAARPNSKVLYISGYTEHTLLHHDVRESGYPLLLKPFVPDVFLRTIRNVLDDVRGGG
jgi:CheY-like chemotaxis protein